jgi:hypothetical protein
MRRFVALLVVAAIAGLSPGCKRPGSAAEAIAPAPSVADATGQSKCGVRKSAAKPLVVEWPSAERAALEAGASRGGLVTVRYEGCEMEVLSTCRAAGIYDYVGLTQKREGVRIRNTDELYAQLPVGAAALEGKLERAGQLNVDMVIVGRKESREHKFNERDLTGRCDDATHVVTGLTVGAFSFYTGASAEIGAGIKVGNIGAGASSSSNQEVLKQDGNGEACVSSGTMDATPPEGCGALLRVEVVPIDRIFATSRPTTSGAEPQATTADITPTPADPRAHRKMNAWRAVTLVSYLGVGGSVGMIYGGAIMRSNDEVAMTEPGSARQDALRKVRIGQGLMWGGVAGAVGFLALGIFANNRWVHYKRQQARTALAPVMLPAGGGLAWGGRF